MNADELWNRVESKRTTFTGLSDRVWDTPELNYAEHRSVAEHRRVLEDEGFRITPGVAGLPTALVGEAGEGGPVVAILGEYDALPGLSQQAGVARHEPVVPGGQGHGCGHNLLGAGALWAATAVKDWLAAHNLPGRVRYYGCPAEEGGSAKGFMVRDGAFDDVDIAISWHPAPFAGVNNPVSLACNEMTVTFTGRAAHAAAEPELGRSALDAVELMAVGVNYVREHMPRGARVHYAVVDAGGIAPNVVQARAAVRYLVRARDLPQLRMLVARVQRIAQGAALMTGTTVATEVFSGDANLVGNPALEALMERHLQRLGPPMWDATDQAFAREIQSTLRPDDIASAFRRFGLPVREGVALCDVLAPTYAGDPGLVGSTDVGTVSWVVPTVQMRGATYAVGTPGHSWQLVAQGKSALAHKGMEHAAKIMAATAADLLRDPALVTAAKEDFAARLAGKTFENPIPPEAQPPLRMSHPV